MPTPDTNPLLTEADLVGWAFRNERADCECHYRLVAISPDGTEHVGGWCPDAERAWGVEEGPEVPGALFREGLTGWVGAHEGGVYHRLLTRLSPRPLTERKGVARGGE